MMLTEMQNAVWTQLWKHSLAFYESNKMNESQNNNPEQ